MRTLTPMFSEGTAELLSLIQQNIKKRALRVALYSYILSATKPKHCSACRSPCPEREHITVWICQCSGGISSARAALCCWLI